MTGDEDATPREMIKETRRDVKWICKALEEIKKTNEAQDVRLTTLEGRQNRLIGRDGAIAVGISTVVAFFTALLSGGWPR